MNETATLYCEAPVGREEVQRQFLRLCRSRSYRSSLVDLRSVLRGAFQSHCARGAGIGAGEHLVIAAAVKALRALLPEGGFEDLAPDVEALLTTSDDLLQSGSRRASLHVGQDLLLALCGAERLMSDAQEFGDKNNPDLLYSEDFAFLARAFQIPL